jgi:membrane-associated phospholipid phosphatase
MQPSASRSASRADILSRTDLVFPAAFLLTVSAAFAPQARATPTPAPPPPDRPITHIFQNLGHDLQRMVSVDSLIVLGVGGAAAKIAGNSDEPVDRWTLENPAPSWTAIGRYGGDGWMMGGLALGTWGVGELTHHRLISHIGSDLIRTHAMNGLFTRGLKMATSRERPRGGGHAFPSGHTSATFATAGVLHEHFGWKVGAPMYAFASFVGYTRIRDRAHWLSDAVFGAALGLASARAVTHDHRSQTWTIAPAAVPGGAAIAFIRRR